MFVYNPQHFNTSIQFPCVAKKFYVELLFTTLTVIWQTPHPLQKEWQSKYLAPSNTLHQFVLWTSYLESCHRQYRHVITSLTVWIFIANMNLLHDLKMGFISPFMETLKTNLTVYINLPQAMFFEIPNTLYHLTTSTICFKPRIRGFYYF